MILAIVGPTGVGKTRLSIALAKKYNAIIINCDAMQIYKEMNIGTAKITENEKENIPHFLFDIKDLDEEYSVYSYQKDARQLIEKYSNKNIIFVGGTGLYLKSALYNYAFESETVNDSYDNYSNEELYELALKKDENIEIHPNNRKRLVRFLNKKKIEIPECKELYKTIYIGLTSDRQTLYERIDNRVEEMFDQGLLEEAFNLYKKYPNSKALHTAIGYKELIAYFNQEISLEEAKELIKKNSRHYAKRQYTWFNNQMNIKWFDVNLNDFNQTIEEIQNYIDKQK